jgi:ubiquinol-cytochrome c reductase iron-sulfur subunit
MTDTAARPEPTRRDFIYIATGAMGVVGTVFTAWPLIDQMNPDESALALASIEVDIAAIQPGTSLLVKWRGRPVVLRNRTEAEVAAAKAVRIEELPDKNARNANLPGEPQALDGNRAAPDREQWLIMTQVCTHLGCVPLGQQGEYNGWFCPCHGSVYDTAGRIRQGPAPENMAIPPYTFISDTVVRIG